MLQNADILLVLAFVAPEFDYGMGQRCILVSIATGARDFSTIMADLDGAKQRLVEALKDRIQRYWELLKSWYRRRVSL